MWRDQPHDDLRAGGHLSRRQDLASAVIGALPSHPAYFSGSCLVNADLHRPVAGSGCSSFACRTLCCQHSVMHSEGVKKLRDPVSRVEHASLHGAWWNANDRRDLVDRSAVVIDEIYDLTMRG